MKRTGKINIVDASFFGKTELTRLTEFPIANIDLFIKNSTSTYGIIKKTNPNNVSDITSFKIFYNSTTGKVEFYEDSLAIDEDGRYIFVPQGTYIDTSSIANDGQEYYVFIEYDVSDEEFGLVKILSIDSKTAEMSWDITGDVPIFAETLRGGSKYPTKIKFTKKSGTLSNTSYFTVLNVDSVNNKATIISDEDSYTEDGLKFMVIGTHEPSSTETSSLYAYDSFKISTSTQSGSGFVCVGSVQYNSTTGRWDVIKDINDIAELGMSHFMTLKNIIPYNYNAYDFAISASDEVSVKNKLNIRTDLEAENVTPTTQGNKGDVVFDENQLMVCVSNNTWKKITLESV